MRASIFGHSSFCQNRPLNSQNVADCLQKFNLKKTAVQRALDALADSGKISFKEYGKQKIYLTRQDQFKIPNSEELTQMKEANAKLQQNLDEQKKAISQVEEEIRTLQSNLTLEQLREKEARLRKEVEELEDKLEILRGGVTLVSPEDRKAIEHMYSEKLSQWRRQKRMFKDIWDAVTENSPKDLKEFTVLPGYFSLPLFTQVVWIKYFVFWQEELGIEYDEDVGVNLQSFSDMLPQNRKRPREKLLRESQLERLGKRLKLPTEVATSERVNTTIEKHHDLVRSNGVAQGGEDGSISNKKEEHGQECKEVKSPKSSEPANLGSEKARNMNLLCDSYC